MKKLIDFFVENSIDYSEEQIQQLNDYMEEILRYNESINLTAIRVREEFIKKHYVDSLIILKSKEFIEGNFILDLGTGGGFPGVPLAIMCPDKKFVLLDSLQKRLNIISVLCEKLSIKNVEVVHGRAEDLGRNKLYRDNFDIVVSRAVSQLNVLCEYSLPFVKKDGFFLAYKGPTVNEEISQSKSAIFLLGGKLLEIIMSPMGEMEHNIIVIEKTKNTPSKYPRKPGIPKKTPL